MAGEGPGHIGGKPGAGATGLGTHDICQEPRYAREQCRSGPQGGTVTRRQAGSHTPPLAAPPCLSPSCGASSVDPSNKQGHADKPSREKPGKAGPAPAPAQLPPPKRREAMGRQGLLV